MSNMILHCGGVSATFEEVCAIQPPDATSTYQPVPHGNLIRLVDNRMKTEFGLSNPEERYGLNKEGKQLFGTLTYDLGETGGANGLDLDAFGINPLIAKDWGFSIAFRNSYDKSMSIGVAGGASCFICDNLALHGSAFTIMRKHTQNVWDNLVPQVMQKIEGAVTDYKHVTQFVEGMKGKQVFDDDAYRTIGLAMGRGVLTPYQGGTTFGEWRAMKKEVHAFHEHGQSAFGLYQAFTQGLKRGGVVQKVDQYMGASALFEECGLAKPVN